MGRGWADIHIGNGVFERFGFDELESRKFIDKSRTKQQRTPHAVYYIPPLLASDDFRLLSRGCIYTLTWGFCVARFDLSGNARASIRGTGNCTAPRFLFH